MTSSVKSAKLEEIKNNLNQDLDIASFLAVGQKVLFDTNIHVADSTRFDVTVLGWKKDSYIILEGHAQKRRSTVINFDSFCALRFMKDGKACAMEVRSIDGRFSNMDSTFRVSWPKQVKYHKIRKEDRINQKCQALLETDDGMTMSAVLHNISHGGCRFYVPIKVNTKTKLKCTIYLSSGMEIKDTVCEVCHIILTAEGTIAGCKFISMPAEQRSKLELYIGMHANMDLGATGDRRVLILDSDLENTLVLEKELNLKGVQVVVQSDLVQFFSWVGTLKPDLVLINSEFQGLGIEQICTIISDTAKESEMPIQLYGASAESLHKTLENKGVEKSYAVTPSSGEILKRISMMTEAPENQDS